MIEYDTNVDVLVPQEAPASLRLETAEKACQMRPITKLDDEVQLTERPEERLGVVSESLADTQWCHGGLPGAREQTPCRWAMKEP